MVRPWSSRGCPVVAPWLFCDRLAFFCVCVAVAQWLSVGSRTLRRMARMLIDKHGYHLFRNGIDG
eukprot:5779071-Pyramimonas_sp.AAC.1